MNAPHTNSFKQRMEFHISTQVRDICTFKKSLFSSTGNIVFSNTDAVLEFVHRYNSAVTEGLFAGHLQNPQYLKTGELNAMGLIDEIYHFVCRIYRREKAEDFFSAGWTNIEKIVSEKHGDPAAFEHLVYQFCELFQPQPVYEGAANLETWFAQTDPASGIPNKILAFEELILLRLANENPAFEPFFVFFDDSELQKNPAYQDFQTALKAWSEYNPPFGKENTDLISLLKKPVEFSPYSIKGQLDYIRLHWTGILDEWINRLLAGIDLIAEDEKAGWAGIGTGEFDMPVQSFENLLKEYERFSPDRDWMPNVVLMAKSTLVWLDQLSKKYGRSITRLDQIPNEELEFLADAGFTGLWLIGIWERSYASARIKQICGNLEAAPSAYSLDDYEIAHELGGWDALGNLRQRAWQYGLRLAADMVPNHSGIVSKWVTERPDLFIQNQHSPFPSYQFEGENLSHDDRVHVYLENRYYSKTDCAVVFKRVDTYTGDVRYIYHGNDGTGLPWNDTAQIDFLNPAAREAVIQKILHVARNFPIIRFDAAMVLAKKHIRRLWYPEPGQGGDIASRSRSALPLDEFENRIPEEFWREVVDRCAAEIPDTLLLAEAFWMMEGYFVRTLGMHRVYNSAFMNMLKREDNDKYRQTIKNTLEFDPEVLKRYVNFMNNPDEETAVAQFGSDDKYFGVCTMMIAMPGLPMFGHGQLEGFTEKYGMEYRRAYYNEQPNEHLLHRHRKEIFPLLKRRALFSGVENFCLYDFWNNGLVNENVFVWSNNTAQGKSLIFYNNVYERAYGWIKTSAAYAVKKEDGSKYLAQKNLGEALALTPRSNYFTLMYEQRSALWYIRSNTEIFDHGFFAVLNGFQTQVFLDIHEIQDTHDTYRLLYESLQGSGIADIQMGLNELLFADLYKTLEQLASPDFFAAFVSCISTSTTYSVSDFAAAYEETALAFFETLAKQNSQQSNIQIKNIWIELVDQAQRLKKAGTWNNTLNQKSPVNDSKKNHEPSSILYAAALILYAAATVLTDTKEPHAGNMITHFALDKKLAAICAKQTEQTAERIALLNCIPDILPLLPFDTTTHEKSFAGILAEIKNSPVISDFLQLHSWDGTQWFNKEAAETLFEFILRFNAAVTKKTPSDKGLSITEFRTFAYKAFTDCGYNADRLCKMYTDKKKQPVKKAASTEKKSSTLE